MAYLLVVRACFFAICIVKGLLQLLWYLLDKSWKGTSRMSLQNRYEPRSSSQLQGQNMLSEGRVRQIHTHTVTLYFLFRISWTSLATDILLWSSSHCFYRFFFLPLDTNWLRGESSFRPEPLRTPPHEPSRVDIQFEYDFKKNIDRYTARNQDDAYALMQACYSPFKCKHCKEYLSPIFEAYPMSSFQPGIALIHVFTDRRWFNNGKTAREYDHYGYHFFERKRKNLSV